MLDKIRLHAAGKLPADYVANLGEGHPNFIDGRCLPLPGYLLPRCPSSAPLPAAPTLGFWTGPTGSGGPRSDEDCRIWNSYMTRIGWRDPRLQQRIREYGLEARSIETFFDLIDADEGRTPGAAEAD